MKQIKQALQKATELLSPRSIVAILGPSGRTWYVDEPLIHEVVLWLLEIGVLIRIGGVLPFDALVERAMASQGIEPECCGPQEPRARLGHERDTDMLLGVDLVVAFPMEGRDVLSADPLIEWALLSNLPVLAIYREKWVWYTSENYVYT